MREMSRCARCARLYPGLRQVVEIICARFLRSVLRSVPRFCARFRQAFEIPCARFCARMPRGALHSGLSPKGERARPRWTRTEGDATLNFGR